MVASGIMLCALWYLSGVASFIFWWTKDYDFQAIQTPLAAGAGILGPIAFIAGFYIHGGDKVLIERKGKTW